MPALAQTATQDSSRTGGGAGLYIALAPWVAFSLLAERVSVQAGAAVALAVAVAIAIPSLRRRSPKTLELAAILAFAGIAAAAFTLDAGSADFLARYARGIAAGLLGVIAFGSLLFTPFTEQYARERAPKAVWGTHEFRLANRKLTILWGAVFAAMVPCHILAGTIDTHRSSLVFNWIVPVALVIWGMKRSSTLADGASAAR